VVVDHQGQTVPTLYSARSLQLVAVEVETHQHLLAHLVVLAVVVVVTVAVQVAQEQPAKVTQEEHRQLQVGSVVLAVVVQVRSGQTVLATMCRQMSEAVLVALV
jgi:hypothetical protein